MRLVERRTVVRRLARAEATALAADWSHVLEVVPTHRSGHYRLTARNWVGRFDAAGRAWEVVPKLGWAAVERLLGDGPTTTGSADGLRSALATRLAELMAERAAAGLVRGYAERPEHSALVRGRIDFPATARRPAGEGVGFVQVVDDFTPDQPWNGWPVAVGGRLLAGPLTAPARAALLTAADGFAGVRPHPSPSPAAWAVDRRLAGYRPLLDWCDRVAKALDGGGLLLNLPRLFEAFLGRLLGPAAVPQRGVLLRDRDGGPGVELRPDLTVVDAAGRATAVWDAKWKSAAEQPRPDDLHQALGYAALLGVRAAGLVYPGRRFTVRRFAAPGGVTVAVVTCRLTGEPARVREAGRRLRRVVLGRVKGG